ncbi:MAG: DUF2961 domain-containing protein [Ignavibacteriales bacterium]|nr:DUF2961 domain-containing protein [Ignavibacteriales bacterium]
MRGIILPLVITSIVGSALAQPESMMSELTRLKNDVKTIRVSSYDTTGNNYDYFKNIEPGETRTIMDVAGAGVVSHIWITIAPAPPKISRNDIVLRMYWDGEETPSVESPIGPFFGQGWDEKYVFVSLPLAAGPKDGLALVSYFQMPFADGARMEIENQSEETITNFYYYIDYYEKESLPEDVGRFHALYRHETTEALPDGENEWAALGDPEENPTGAENYVVCEIEGRGHYVGVNYYVHSPTPMWYGEGDDMFFIDGEPFPPSLHGTGTEDYFNTAWCPQEELYHPFYGYPRVNEQFGWMGRTHVYRFHITDPVYFDESLLFSIEHGHNNALTLDLSTVAYWYQSEPHKPFPPLPSVEERAPKPFISPYNVHRWRHNYRENMGGDPEIWGKEWEEK